MSNNEMDSPIKEFLWLLWVRKGSVLVVAMITAGVALLYSSRQPKAYSSVAEVLVQPVTLEPLRHTGASEDVFLEPQKKIATSAAVARLATEHLGNVTKGTISVSGTEESNALVFRSSSSNPVSAQRMAQAYAESYLKFRRDQVIDSLREASETLDERIEVLGQQIADVGSRLPLAESDPQRKAIELRIESLAEQRKELEKRRNALEFPRDFKVGQLLQPAELPAASPASGRGKTMTFALFVGLSLGCGLALLRARLDPRLQGRSDLALGAGAPVLALIPEERRPKPEERGATPELELLTKLSTKTPDAEAYRSLRATLLFAINGNAMRSLVVTAASAGDGKTSTTANLGVVLALAGKEVILVSADVDNPRLQLYFPPEHEVGLTNVLKGECGLGEGLSPTFVSGLRVLHAGRSEQVSRELMSSESMRTLLERLEREADLVLIDSPPVLSGSDTLHLASIADGVLLVAAAERTTLAGLSEARLRLGQVGARVIGAVLNNVDRSRARFDQRPFYEEHNHGLRSPSRAEPLSSGDEGWSA